MDPKTIPALLAESAQRFADHPAVTDGDTTLSFAELQDRARQAARALLARDIQLGDRIAIWAPNMWEWMVAALSVHLVGGVVVPINTRYKGGEAGYLLGKSGARLLFTVTDFLATDYVQLLREADVLLPSLESIVTLRGHSPEGTSSWAEFLADASGVSQAACTERAAQVTGDCLADILFTSGTTGNPKGVMCTHEQSLRAFRSWSEVVGLNDKDRYLVVAPFFHCFGYKAGWLAALMTGATVLPQPVFDVQAVLERIGPDRVTVLPGPPALYQSILGHPALQTFDLSTLRLAVTGAAVIPVELIRRMKEELRFQTVITGYGLTEATGIATMCRFDDDPETIATTSGRAIPDVEVRVVDDKQIPVAPGMPGEVQVRGYNVMKGYFDDPHETANAVTKDGWLLTGDIGILDDRGYIKITDRKKDMYIVGGFNAYPAEIENILLGHQDLMQAAVIGIPDPRLGEVGMAFVVARPGASVTADELLDWSRPRMANYKVPRRIELLDALPMNASGKVLKYELRQRA